MRQRSNRYAAQLKAAERRRLKVQDKAFLQAVSALTPLGASLRGLGVALMLATGAFVLTMLKDPPRSEASDPVTVTQRPVDLQVPTGIPGADCLSSPMCQ